MPTKAKWPKALHSRVSVLLFLFLIKSTTTKDTVDTSQLIEITSFSWHHNNAFHVIEINGRWRTSCFQQDEQEGHLEAWEGTEVCSQIRHQHLHAAYTRNCYKIAERPAVGVTWTPEIVRQAAVQMLFKTNNRLVLVVDLDPIHFYQTRGQEDEGKVHLPGWNKALGPLWILLPAHIPSVEQTTTVRLLSPLTLDIQGKYIVLSF